MSSEQPVSSDSDKSEGSRIPRRPVDIQRGQLASGRIMGTAFALIGGFLAWVLLEALYPVFMVPQAQFGPFDEPTEEQAAHLIAGVRWAGLSNTVAALAWTGALLAGAMAVGEGWARRSVKIVLLGSIGCALIGGALGSLAGWLGFSVFYSHITSPRLVPDLQTAVWTQVSMLAMLGAGVGLALGSLTGSLRGVFVTILGGVLAGGIAGMICPIAAAYLMPTLQVEHGYLIAGHIPGKGVGALVWLAIASVLLGAVIPGLKLRRTREAAGAG